MYGIITLFLSISAVYSKPTISKRADINGEIVPGKWIVQLAPQAVLNDALIKKLSNVSGIKVDKKTAFNLDGLVKGFTVKANDSAIDSLADYSSLVSVQPATVLRAAVVVAPKGYGATASKVVTQKDGTWGLDRISHQKWTYSSRDFPENLTEYKYDPSAALGSTVYVVDTGVYTAHNDFRGRAVNGANFVAGEGFEDGNGHGTNVAGLIAGTRYGVAKKTKLMSVKALAADGSSDTSVVLQALEWIHKDATNNKRRRKSVVNLSFDGPFDQILNDALAKAGLFVVVAAGNYASDANYYSPASAPGACAVGSMTYINTVNTFSNFGPKVALYAPGFRIIAAANTGPDAVSEMTGTSQAAPHVAGLAAYLLRLDSSKYVAKTLCQQMQGLATKNQLKNDDGTPLTSGTSNLIAFNGVAQQRR
ncbi:Putative peptidase S8/S53 domain, peptidase S8, subtilisin, His-active [Septoria linicola]|uniref:Peptidase S8/S53 domain, peptidase S8, subtilisin, His-active n=1 Tax=Septoria linicola TaxID=215465 RepID=A0A9Q9B667_9PEZI|nr:Putative peptidase S8/S53 domain, peptidase S8, subtilisin, His-active [Septoria linicola]